MCQAVHRRKHNSEFMSMSTKRMSDDLGTCRPRPHCPRRKLPLADSSNVPEAQHCRFPISVPLCTRTQDTPTCGGLRAEWTHITEVCGDVVGPHNVCMAQSLAQLGPQQVAALQGACAVPMDAVQDLQQLRRLEAKQQSPCCYAAAGISGSRADLCQLRKQGSSRSNNGTAGRLRALPAPSQSCIAAVGSICTPSRQAAFCGLCHQAPGTSTYPHSTCDASPLRSVCSATGVLCKELGPAQPEIAQRRVLVPQCIGKGLPLSSRRS